MGINVLSAELNTILDNIQVGDIFSIYYNGATRNVNASTLTVGVVNYLYVQNQDWNTYSSDVVGSYNDNLRYENGYQEIISSSRRILNLNSSLILRWMALRCRFITKMVF